MTNPNVITNLEKTIKSVSNKIRKEDSIDPSKITSLAKLVTALTALSGTIRDPMEYGDPYYVDQLEAEAKERQRQTRRLIKRKGTYGSVHPFRSRMRAWQPKSKRSRNTVMHTGYN